MKKTEKTVNFLTHTDLKKSIRSRYEASHWVVIDEVRDASGFDSTRSIDTIAFGLYSSRGYEVHAFECKASRSDWLKELQQPDKADEFAKITDKFWIVANKGVVEKEELPIGWGLIVARKHGEGFRTRIHKQAVMWDWAGSPLPRPFVASMLTRFRKELDKWTETSVLQASIKDELRSEFNRGIEIGENRAQTKYGHFHKLKEQVDSFEKASGISISRYIGGKDLGKKVALVTKLQSLGGWEGFEKQAKRLSMSLSNSANDIDERIDNIKKKCIEMFTFDEESND